jgi:hypothetical protein
MFATQTDKKTKSLAEPKSGQADTSHNEQASHEPNPVWQSLAVRPVSIQAKLAISQPNDPAELEADSIAERVMRMAAPQSIGSKLSFSSASTLTAQRLSARRAEEEGEKIQLKGQRAMTEAVDAAPPIVHEALNSAGQPLDPLTRSFMEERFRHDFVDVRVHTDAWAAESARAVNALAYTSGHDVVFAEGQYAPATSPGRTLIAHELTHVAQQQAGGRVALQRQTPDAGAAPQRATPVAAVTPAAATPPRTDYVFIMGQDQRRTGNPFYQMALRYYRAHVPNAIFVTNLRNLTDLLAYIAANVGRPIGNLYIVSHANEDGTLSFGLNAADADRRLSLPELRTTLHPAGGGPSPLANVTAQVDARTRIHIKGCDIGRTPGMVELIDEAFGGAGTVTAPTHEQGYGTDPTLAAAERVRVHDRMMATYTTTLPPVPPQPAPVDPSLRGAARQQALADRRAAMQARQQVIQQRQRAIAREEQRIRPQVDQAAEVAGTFESFSGPMFQHPGTVLFTAVGLEPEVQRLYPQLSEPQQRSLVRRLVARDPRSEAVANQQGTFRQQGQRMYRKRPQGITFTEPRTLREANRALMSQFRQNHFTPTALRPMQRQPVQGGTELTLVIEGRVAPPGAARFNNVMTFTFGPVPTDAALIEQGRARISNPDRYNWRIEESHNSSGQTTRTAVAERVIAYLHHGSLDPSPHTHFTQPESNPDFFATSTFAPPPPAAPAPPARPRPRGGP